MKRVMQIGRAMFIALCLCYIFNLGGAQTALVRACVEAGTDFSTACVTRPGGNNICDCIDSNCGKVCSRSISLQCQNGTCRAAQPPPQ